MSARERKSKGKGEQREGATQAAQHAQQVMHATDKQTICASSSSAAPPCCQCLQRLPPRTPKPSTHSLPMAPIPLASSLLLQCSTSICIPLRHSIETSMLQSSLPNLQGTRLKGALITHRGC